MNKKMHHYTDGGLKNVWLQNGFEIRSTPYGKGVAIHNVEGLTKAICLALVAKTGTLNGNEFRYIRIAGMLLSQVSLGTMMGADAQSIERWEKHGRLSKWADKMIRVIYLAHTDGDQKVSSVVNRITTVERLIQRKIVVSEIRNKGWRSNLVSS